MFDRNTVVILGAGASWHYGYPTGEDLVNEVMNAASNLANHFEYRIQLKFRPEDCPDMLTQRSKLFSKWEPWARYEAGIKQCRELAERLRTVSPLVIDYFLGWNPDLADLGRTLIALALYHRARSKLENYNRHIITHRKASKDYKPENVKDNWIRFVVHQLLLSCSSSSRLQENKVSFITFNYDRSLEIALHKALRATKFLDDNDIGRFMRSNRILHMYGALEPIPTSNFDTNITTRILERHSSPSSDEIKRDNDVLNFCHRSGKNIRVIDPHNKDLGDEPKLARSMISNAEKIYILGFGFDLNNVKRLGFADSLPGKSRAIYFSNLGNSSAVNKRAANAFGLNALRNPNEWQAQLGAQLSAEKSIRDCYNALALDFSGFDDCSSPN